MCVCGLMSVDESEDVCAVLKFRVLVCVFIFQGVHCRIMRVCKGALT